MVAAAKSVEVLVVTSASVAVSEGAEVVAEAVVMVLEVSSPMGSFGGFWVAQRSWMLLAQSSWASWSLACCTLHWPKSVLQTKVGIVWV